MSTGKAGFPRTPNGYSPQHVDEFVGALAQRAKTQITALERRVQELQSSATPTPPSSDLTERVAMLERLLAERDAQLSEERTRVAMLQARVVELEATTGAIVEIEPMEVLEVDAVAQEEPQDWAASVIGRDLYHEWTDEQRVRAAESLRRKRLSACTPVD